MRAQCETEHDHYREIQLGFHKLVNRADFMCEEKLILDQTISEFL